MKIALESPLQAEAVALVAELDAHQAALYPPESRHALDMAALAQANVLFAIARVEGKAMGCAALLVERGHAELKRLYVRPAHRGRGVARALLQFLEQQVAPRGCSLLKLETGTAQPDAIALYRSMGFVPCGRFGNYGVDPLSVFMEKLLMTPQSLRSCPQGAEPGHPQS